MHDLYDARRPKLDALGADLEPPARPARRLAVVEGQPVALDAVSEPDVFASLLLRLAQGYALDALGKPPAPVDAKRVEAFLHAALEARRRCMRPSGEPGHR